MARMFPLGDGSDSRDGLLARSRIRAWIPPLLVDSGGGYHAPVRRLQGRSTPLPRTSLAALRSLFRRRGGVVTPSASHEGGGTAQRGEGWPARHPSIWVD